MKTLKQQVLILKAIYPQKNLVEIIKTIEGIKIKSCDTEIGIAKNIVMPEKWVEGQFFQIYADIELYEDRVYETCISELLNKDIYPVITYEVEGLNIIPETIYLLPLLKNEDRNKTDPIRIMLKSDIRNLTLDQIEYLFRLSFAAIQMSDYFHFISRTNGTIYIEIKREIEREKRIVFTGNIFPNYDIQLVSNDVQYEPTRNQVEYLRCINNDLGVK